MNVPSLVGYTESKKPIYLFDLNETAHFSGFYADFRAEENFDAMAIFSYLQLVYWRRYSEYYREYGNALRMGEFFEDQLSDIYVIQRKSELKLPTAFDVSKYGCKHCLPHLQELIFT